MSLSFENLREKNVPRSNETFHLLDEWNLLEWGGALAGEAGEAANKAKKIVRGDHDIDDPGVREELAKELADVVIYADLMAAAAGVDLGRAIIRKFNEVSQKKGSAVFLQSDEAEIYAGACKLCGDTGFPCESCDWDDEWDS